MNEAQKYLQESRCPEMEEFLAAVSKAPESGFNPFRVRLNDTASEEAIAALGVVQEACIHEYSCKDIEGRLHMDLRNTYRDHFETLLVLTPSTNAARRDFFTFVQFTIGSLRKETEGVKEVLRLNEVHREPIEKAKNDTGNNLLAAVSCGVATIASAVYSTFQRCLQRPRRR